MIRKAFSESQATRTERHFKEQDALAGVQEENYARSAPVNALAECFVPDIEDEDPYNRTGKFVHVRPVG